MTGSLESQESRTTSRSYLEANPDQKGRKAFGVCASIEMADSLSVCTTGSNHNCHRLIFRGSLAHNRALVLTELVKDCDGFAEGVHHGSSRYMVQISAA